MLEVFFDDFGAEEWIAKIILVFVQQVEVEFVGFEDCSTEFGCLVKVSDAV